MRARELINKRIVRVNQTRWRDPEYGWRLSIDSITLDNGATIVFNTKPTIDSPIATATVCKPQKGERDGKHS